MIVTSLTSSTEAVERTCRTGGDCREDGLRDKLLGEVEMSDHIRLTQSTLYAFGFAQKALSKMPELAVWPGTTWHWLDISTEKISAKKWGARFEAKKIEFFGWLPCLRYARAIVTLYGANGHWNLESVEVREWSEISTEDTREARIFSKSDLET